MVSTRVTPNATPTPINIVGGSVFGRYNKVSSEYTQNMFITTNGAQPGTETFEAWLVNFPGYKRLLNFTPQLSPLPVAYPDQLPAGTGRGLFHSVRGNFALAVVNSTVYRLDVNLNVTTVGIISSTTGDVYMAENLSQQVAIVDGVNCWIYNYNPTGAALTLQVLNPNLVPNYVEYHNTFFLFGNGNTTGGGSQWYAYEFDTNTTIQQVNTGTNFLALETKADTALAVKRIPGRGNNVLVMGATVCEIWTQVNGFQTYLRNQSVNINYGCLSVATIGEGGNLLAWLGANEDEAPVIMVYDGNQATSISTDGIDYLLSTIKAPQTSTAMLYRQDGHLFYMLTFYDPRDNLTLLYDFDTKLFFNLTDQAGNFHPARQIIYFNLNVYFVSIRNTALYQLSSNITAINENLPLTSINSPFDPELLYDIPRTRICANIRQANSTRFRANSTVITLEQGTDEGFTEANLQQAIQNAVITEQFYNPPYDDILTEDGQIVVTENAFNAANNIINPTINYLFPGLATNTIYIPRIDLSISKDGGITFGTEVGRNLHFLGARQNILHWENMGVANDLVLRFRFWGKYRFIVSNGEVDIIL